MTDRHTPAPWRIVPDQTNQNDRRITAKRNTHIAKVYGWADVETPNARLIAAAPDLLAALIDAESRLRGAGMLGGEEDIVSAAVAAATST